MDLPSALLAATSESLKIPLASELLVPFFLAAIGLHFNRAALASWPTVTLALARSGAAVASKPLGCGIGAHSLGRRRASAKPDPRSRDSNQPKERSNDSCTMHS
jgi:hypothetical protein